VLAGDELEVDGMHNGPDLPGSLNGAEQVVLDLVGNLADAVAIDESQVGEENRHEDGTPEDLVNAHLEGDGLGVRALNLGIQPVVKVVTGGAVVDEAKEGESQESLHVKGTARNENLATLDENLFVFCSTHTYLCQDIAQGPSNQGSHSLGEQRLLIQGVIVGSPSGDGTTTDRLATKERRAFGQFVAAAHLDRLDGGCDAKGADREEGRGSEEDERHELHGGRQDFGGRCRRQVPIEKRALTP